MWLKKLLDSNYLSLSLIILFSLIFSATNTIGVERDYSFYYLTSNLLGNENILYENYFSHKGPLYFLFINFIKYIIGDGVLEYKLIHFFTVLFFSICSYFIFYNHTQKKILSFLIVSSLFFNQNTGISIQLFQSTLIILGLFFFDKFSKNKKLSYFSISTVFIILAIFTRIDAIIFMPLLIYKLFYSKNKIILVSVFSLISVSLYLFFFMIYKFSFSQFFNHNFVFNFMYAKQDSGFMSYILRILSKENFIIYFLITGGVYFMSILLKYHKKLSSTDKYLISVPLIFFLISATDKNYHFLIFFVPFIFVVSKNLIHSKSLLQGLTISLVFTLSSISIGFARVIKDNTTFFKSDFYNKIIYTNSEIRDFLTKNPNTIVLGGFAGDYIFTNLNPKFSINNMWLYRVNKPFENKSLTVTNMKIINDQEDFLMSKFLFEQKNKNPFLLKLKKKFRIKRRIGNYYLMTYKDE